MEKAAIVLLFSILVLTEAQITCINTQILKLGDFEIISIQDIQGKVMYDEIFTEGATDVPVDPSDYTDELIRMGYTISNDSFTVPVSVMIVKNQNLGLLFMIDSGEGLNLTSGHSQLLNSLNCLKIDPSSIQHIILTHAHPDHCGGLVGVDGVTPVFPNAQVVIGYDEYYYWMQTSPDWGDFCCPAELNATLPLVQSALSAYPTVLITENTEIFPDVYLSFTCGHTSPEPLAVKIIYASKSALWVMGDTYFSPVHMEEHTYGCTHDHEMQNSINTRAQYVQLFEPGDLLFGMHFAFPGFGNYNVTSNVYNQMIF